jgi:MFS family permease
METVTGFETSGFRYVLGRTDFRLVWLAQVAAQCADKFVMFSLIVLAYDLSRADTPVAVTLLAYTLPALFIPPFAGVFADRHDRKTTMVWTNFGRAGVVMLIPLSNFIPIFQHDFLHLLVITFAFSALGQFFSPAEAAAIPTLLPRRALLTANSMVLLTMVFTLLFGGAAAPVLSRIDRFLPYWVATVFLVVGGCLIALATIPKSHPERIHTRSNAFQQMVVEVQEGLDYLRNSSVLMASFAQMSLTVLVLFMMFTLAPAYVDKVIGIQAQDSYIILLPATLGAVASAFLLGTYGRRLRPARLVAGALLATGLTLLALSIVPFGMRELPYLRDFTRYFAAAFSLLLGLEFGALLIPSLTYLQEHTDDQVRGRIFSLFFLAYNGATAIPVLAAAALADLFGIALVIAGLGVALAISGVVIAMNGERVYGPKEARL